MHRIDTQIAIHPITADNRIVYWLKIVFADMDCFFFNFLLAINKNLVRSH